MLVKADLARRIWKENSVLVDTVKTLESFPEEKKFKAYKLLNKEKHKCNICGNMASVSEFNRVESDPDM